MNEPEDAPVAHPPPSLPVTDTSDPARKLATLVYALQAAAFLIGITALIGIVINYLKIDDVRGTWLESHFRWQMRTFWYGLLWGLIGLLAMFIVIGWAMLVANTVWIIYRIVKGWMRLAEGKPMYVES